MFYRPILVAWLLVQFCQTDVLANESLKTTRFLCTKLIADLSGRYRDRVTLEEMLGVPFIHPWERRLMNPDGRRFPTFLGSPGQSTVISADSPMPPFKNIPADVASEVLKEFRQEAGVIHLMDEGSDEVAFMVDSAGVPRLLVSRAVYRTMVEHELAHFKDWVVFRAAFLAQGKPPLEAALEAALIQGTILGKRFTERHAIAKEWGYRMAALIENEDGGVLPPELEHLEFTLSTFLYPETEALMSVFLLRQQTYGLSWTLTRWTRAGREFLDVLDRTEKELIQETVSMATECRDLMESALVEKISQLKRTGEIQDKETASQLQERLDRLREIPLAMLILREEIDPPLHVEMFRDHTLPLLMSP